MDLTLQELLEVAGTLDNRPGFDAPRERFRRFLSQHVKDVRLVFSLIEQGQHALGEQNYCALQDLVTLLGRFLGFETAFGTYQPLAGSVKYDGHWNSRGSMHIIVEVRCDQSHERDLDRTSRSLTALSDAANIAITGKPIALCVLMPSYVGRTALLEQAAAQPHPDIRIVSIKSLRALALLAGARKIRHEEVLQVFKSGFDLELLASLLERCATPSVSAAFPAPKLVERR